MTPSDGWDAKALRLRAAAGGHGLSPGERDVLTARAGTLGDCATALREAIGRALNGDTDA